MAEAALSTMPGGLPSVQDARYAAISAAEAGDFASAATQFAAAVQLCPTDGALHEQLAQCLMELEHHKMAVAAAETATALEPQWSDAWATLARCYLNSGQLRSAQQAFSRSLTLDPDQPEVHAELSEISNLIQQQLKRQVGLPGLTITVDPAGQLGPGCMMWEAGIRLAQLLVANVSPKAATATVTATDSPTSHDSTCGCKPNAAQHNALASAGSANGLEHVQWPLRPPAGMHILEVGAGTGIVGITAAALAAHVTLTDLPQLQPLLKANIAANAALIRAAGGTAAAAVLDWDPVGTQSEDVELLQGQQWDVAIGADLVYNSSQVNSVVRMIAVLLISRCDNPGAHGTALESSVAAPAEHHQDLVLQQAPLQPPPAAAADAATPAGNTLRPAAVQAGRAASSALLQAVQTNAAPSAAAQPVCAAFLLAHKHRHQQVDAQLLDALQRAGLQVQVVQQHVCRNEQQTASSQSHQQQHKWHQPDVVQHQVTTYSFWAPPAAAGEHGISLWWITSRRSGSTLAGGQCSQRAALSTGGQCSQRAGMQQQQ